MGITLILSARDPLLLGISSIIATEFKGVHIYLQPENRDCSPYLGIFASLGLACLCLWVLTARKKSCILTMTKKRLEANPRIPEDGQQALLRRYLSTFHQ